MSARLSLQYLVGERVALVCLSKVFDTLLAVEDLANDEFKDTQLESATAAELFLVDMARTLPRGIAAR